MLADLDGPANVIPLRLLPAICLLVLIAVHSAMAADTAPADAGAQLYATYCSPCHGAHLAGYAADNAPSLLSQTFRETATDAFLRAATEQGRAGTAMAGYGKAVGGPLGREDIDALIAYMRGGMPAPAPLPDQPATGDAANGQRVYAANCESCHGTSDQRASALHLANAMFLATASDAFLRYAIVRGRPGTLMEPWASRLPPEQIDDVVAYLRSLARPVPPAPALPAAAANANAPSRRGAAPQATPAASGREAAPVLGGPVVLNPTGEQADFKLRSDRYASVADVGKAYEEKRRLVIIDARTTSDYLRLHIAGAISIPYFDMSGLANILNDGTWIIAYCACPHHVSGIVVDELRKRGYEHSAVLDEGVFAWQQQGHAVVAAAGQLPIPAPPPPANGTPVTTPGQR